MTIRLRTVGLIAGVMLLAACGGDGDSPVKRAEAEVTAKERALSEAQSEATAAIAEFCGASEAYIVALDRYGDVLNATAPTVGDVKDAGSDLSQPREDTSQAADAAVEAQAKVVAAEQELADARAALAEVKASAGGPSGSNSPGKTGSSSVPPLPPTKSIDRVKQAESDFAAAQQAITDQTPLLQASQQFNAAAVALEMSWLRLYADAGCLARQQKQAEAAVSDYTTTLQQALSDAGYYQGHADGVYGPETVDAIEALQQAHGLPVTGTVDKATDAALDSDLQVKGGADAQEAVASTAAIQQTLHLAGFWDGPIDGNWTPELTDALTSFQTELGVNPTGTVDAATIAALEQAIAAAQPLEQPSATASSTTPTPTATSSTSP